ncbi:MAG: polyphosphate kinase 1 [Lachnospirales bacterium]
MSHTLFTQNRELSWLKFNELVLDESMEKNVPLLERLRFIAIFSSNLDEFFMVRVGSLFDLNYVSPYKIDIRSNLTPSEQLTKIYETVKPLYLKREQYFAKINEELTKNKIYHCNFSDLTENQKKEAKKYFNKNIKPILSPYMINVNHPIPHFENKQTYVLVLLALKNKKFLSIIPLPKEFPSIFPFNNDADFLQYICVEDIFLEFIDLLFKDYKVLEKTKFRLTRNADLNFDSYIINDDFDFDFDIRNVMKSALKKRKKLAPVRLELSSKISDEILFFLLSKLSLSKNNIYISSIPFNLNYTLTLGEKVDGNIRKNLEFEKFSQRNISSLTFNESVFKQVEVKDILLSYPFESMEPFLNLLKKAITYKKVKSIKITIYRLATTSKLAHYLCEAAEKGIEVVVLIELKARFDEQNNLDWSKRLEQSGCKIIYGIEGYKVHSKLCLITYENHNKIKYITQVSTGNFNEKTVKFYTDLALITSNQEIGNDANNFFQNMTLSNLNGIYNHLLVAPNTFKTKILDLIKEEGEKGNNGYIYLKLNSLTDIDIINALQNASQKGVTVNMSVRGICCLLPQIDNLTENIYVTNIIGRFLEHSRIYVFGKNKNVKIYISSADLMTRNTEKRVEVACPIYEDNIKNKILKIIDIIQSDNVKSRILLSDGNYIRKNSSQPIVNSQDFMIANSFESENNIKKFKLSSLFKFLKS